MRDDMGALLRQGERPLALPNGLALGKDPGTSRSVDHLLQYIGNRFDHILVNEYQDTNRLQADILMALRPGGRGLTVVGDDAQSIYSFRAANIRNILDFPCEFSPRPADVITLDCNYRSTQLILAAANGVIELAWERYTRNLRTDRISAQRPMLVTVKDEIDQATYVVDQVLANREIGIVLKQQAVLFRTSSHSSALEVELTRRNVPFVKFGGLKFLDSAYVKDGLAVIRFSQNPPDRVVGFRRACRKNGGWLAHARDGRGVDCRMAGRCPRWADGGRTGPQCGYEGGSGRDRLRARCRQHANAGRACLGGTAALCQGRDGQGTRRPCLEPGSSRWRICRLAR